MIKNAKQHLLLMVFSSSEFINLNALFLLVPALFYPVQVPSESRLSDAHSFQAIFIADL